MTANMSQKERKNKEEKPRIRERKKRKSSSTFFNRRKYRVKRRKNNNTYNNTEIVERKIELCDLSEEVLIAILEHVSAPGLINTSKTCSLFHRLCHTDSLWKHRCKVKFNLL